MDIQRAVSGSGNGGPHITFKVFECTILYSTSHNEMCATHFPFSTFGNEDNCNVNQHDAAFERLI